MHEEDESICLNKSKSGKSICDNENPEFNINNQSLIIEELKKFYIEERSIC